MKIRIESHEESLKNMQDYLSRLNNEYEELKKRRDTLSDDIFFLQYQIGMAIDAKKDGFDAERYKIKDR